MKLVPPKDLGSIDHTGTIHFACNVLSLYTHLRACIDFLAMYDK
jgi:hypothetical protein